MVGIFGRRDCLVCAARRCLFVFIDSSFVETHTIKFDKSTTFDFTVTSTMSPNKSPEPTAVGAGSSAIAVHVASRRWLSFFR